MSQKVRIRKNDQVLVIAGRDRGARGRVLRVLPGENRAIVEGVNMIKRHTRPNPQKQVQGGVLEREAAIHISNLMVIDPDGQATRVGLRRLADGGSVRVSKKGGATLN